MTTTVTKTIRASGGDFTTGTAWEAALQGNLTTALKWGATTFTGTFVLGEALTFTGSGATGTVIDTDGSTYILFHVTSGTPATADVLTGGTSAATCTLSGAALDTGVIIVGEFYDDWASGLNDAVYVNGSTVDATHYRKLTVAPGNRHGGIPGAGFWQYNAGADVFRAGEMFVVFEYVEGRYTGSSGYVYGVRGTDWCSINSCIGTSTAWAGAGIMLAATVGSSPSTAMNCLAYSCAARGIGFNASQQHQAFNCVAANCGTGFDVNNAAHLVKNCVSYNNTTNWGTTFDAASTNNATSSTSDDAPGANSVWNITSADFVNAAANDFHLSSGSALRGAGANLYSLFTTDIDGDTWPAAGAWDIGFDYFVSSGLSIAAGLGAASVTRYAPTIAATANVAATPGVGSETITSYAPTAAATGSVAATPGLGATTFAGSVPATLVSTLAIPGTAALTISTAAPTTVAIDNHYAQPGVGSAVFTGLAPTAAYSGFQYAAPGAAAVALTTMPPSITYTLNHATQPGAGTVVIGPLPPTIGLTASYTVTPGSGTIVIDTYVIGGGDTGFPTKTWRVAPASTVWVVDIASVRWNLDAKR